ncbi:MAG: antitoxin Xre-like helix-turn-helix domain-containing protein [Pseudomonadota bacterium]
MGAVLKTPVAGKSVPGKTAAKSVSGKNAAKRIAPAGSVSSSMALADIDFDHIYTAAPQERIDVIRRGVPAKHLGVLSVKMNMPKESLMDSLGLSRATVSRKVREDKALSQDESERILGVEALIGQVRAMVAESGDPAGFDAAKWVSGWLNSPLPALGGSTPASYMDTVEGQKLVASLLAMSQSGAYA